jgi:hypothetical protein
MLPPNGCSRSLACCYNYLLPACVSFDLTLCYCAAKDTRKYFRLDVSGYFAFFAANVDITLRRRYVFHSKLMRAEFAKILHAQSLKHQNREQPVFPSEIAHRIADIYAALYWDELDPSLCLRAVGMPPAATWLA